MNEGEEKTHARVIVCLRRIAFGNGVGGMERAAADHVKQLLLCGYQVTLLTPLRFLTGRPPLGVKVVDVAWPKWNAGTGAPTFGLAYAAWVRRLRITLKAEAKAGDVVHLHGASAG
ncbi:hypothetical protein, partial [Escherichia coli]|uniref:hypothetical protein n=1 Tax=Escherichia coli TaxID=562 RepID=UPI0032E4A578